MANEPKDRRRAVANGSVDLWGEVWAIVYSAILLDPENRHMGRMKGVESLHEQAAREAAQAHRAWWKYVRGESPDATG
jgi:hypothetical protein